MRLEGSDYYQPNIPERQSNVSIVHLEDSDIVLSNERLDAETAKKLVDLVKTSKGVIQQEDLPEGFFMKWKTQKFGTPSLKALRNDYKPSSYSVFDKQSGYGFHSVMNEFAITKKVESIIESDEAQQIAKKYGFNSVRLVPPIMGIVNRKLRMKWLVYNNVPGKDFHKWHNEHLEAPANIDLANDFEELFRKNSIVPGDIDRRQFMVTEENGKPVLNLTDIEAYHERA